MKMTSQQKGKFGELWVFSRLLEMGAHVYLPLVDDQGIDAVLRRKDDSLVEIQVKSTRSEEQAGYFNATFQPRDNLFIICVDLSPLDEVPSLRPEVWCFPSHVFSDQEYSTKSKDGEYRLPLAARSRKHENRPRKDLLRPYREAWGLVTGVTG